MGMTRSQVGAGRFPGDDHAGAGHVLSPVTAAIFEPADGTRTVEEIVAIITLMVPKRF